MSDYGIKISRPGIDVKGGKSSAPGDLVTPVAWPSPYNLNFYSGWFVYKIVATGTASGAVPASGVGGAITTLSVTHSLGYAPMVDMYFTIDGGVSWWANNSETQGSPTGTPLQSASVQSTATNISIEAFGVSMGAYTLTARYLIYADFGS